MLHNIFKGGKMNYLVYQIHDRHGNNMSRDFNSHKEAVEELKRIRQNDKCGYYKIELVTKGEE